MKYGYARVSTQGQNLEEQVNQLIKAGVEPQNVFKEKFTGTTSLRPQFKLLQSKIKGGDELVVTKLDRLGRKTNDIITFLDNCGKRGITINILNLGRLDNTPSGKLMRNVIGAFAEYERDMIVTRTQEGKKYAKLHKPNYKEGRPKRVINSRYRKIYDYSKTHSIRETAETTGVSISTVNRIRRQVKAQVKAEQKSI